MVHPTGRPLAACTGPARLTRRGRVVVVALAVIALFGIFSLGRVSLLAATAVPSAPPLRHVTVTVGQTLWDVATRADPGADPRLVVDALIAANRLPGPAVFPGEVLTIPNTV